MKNQSYSKTSAVNPWVILFYEFCGTALMTYTYDLSPGLDPLMRAYAYFLGFIIAYQVSGAHFNPATSLAVFISEKQCKNFVVLLITMITQFIGSLAGIFVAYLLAKYTNFEIYPDRTPSQKTGTYLYFSDSGSPYWGRLVLHEFMQTFTFTLVYLIVKYDKTMQRMDRLTKAFVLVFTLFLCNSLTLGSGSVFNPAIGFAQSMYMIGIYNSNGSGLGNNMAICTWVYMVVPFAGAAAAAVFYYLHKFIDTTPEKQTEPMQFMQTEDVNGNEVQEKEILLKEDHDQEEYERKAPSSQQQNPGSRAQSNHKLSNQFQAQQIYQSQPSSHKESPLKAHNQIQIDSERQSDQQNNILEELQQEFRDETNANADFTDTTGFIAGNLGHQYRPSMEMAPGTYNVPQDEQIGIQYKPANSDDDDDDDDILKNLGATR